MSLVLMAVAFWATVAFISAAYLRGLYHGLPLYEESMTLIGLCPFREGLWGFGTLFVEYHPELMLYRIRFEYGPHPPQEYWSTVKPRRIPEAAVPDWGRGLRLCFYCRRYSRFIRCPYCGKTTRKVEWYDAIELLTLEQAKKRLEEKAGAQERGG